MSIEMSYIQGSLWKSHESEDYCAFLHTHHRAFEYEEELLGTYYIAHRGNEFEDEEMATLARSQHGDFRSYKSN